MATLEQGQPQRLCLNFEWWQCSPTKAYKKCKMICAFHSVYQRCFLAVSAMGCGSWLMNVQKGTKGNDTHCHLHCLGAKPQSQSHGTARPCHGCDHPRRQSVCNSLGLHGKMRGVFGSSLQLKKLKFCWHMDMRSQTSRRFALPKTSGIQSIYKRAKVNLQAISPTSHDYVLHYSSQIRCYEAFWGVHHTGRKIMKMAFRDCPCSFIGDILIHDRYDVRQVCAKKRTNCHCCHDHPWQSPGLQCAGTRKHTCVSC